MLSLSPDEFLQAGRLPRGVGAATLSRLVQLGLAEQGVTDGPAARQAWRISALGRETIPTLKLEPVHRDAVPWLAAQEGDALPGIEAMRCCCARMDERRQIPDGRIARNKNR